MSAEKESSLKLGLAAEEYLLITVPPSTAERTIRVYNRAKQQIKVLVEAAKDIKVNRRGWKVHE